MFRVARRRSTVLFQKCNFPAFLSSYRDPCQNLFWQFSRFGLPDGWPRRIKESFFRVSDRCGTQNALNFQTEGAPSKVTAALRNSDRSSYVFTGDVYYRVNLRCLVATKLALFRCLTPRFASSPIRSQQRSRTSGSAARPAPVRSNDFLVPLSKLPLFSDHSLFTRVFPLGFRRIP